MLYRNTQSLMFLLLDVISDRRLYSVSHRSLILLPLEIIIFMLEYSSFIHKIIQLGTGAGCKSPVDQATQRLS